MKTVSVIALVVLSAIFAGVFLTNSRPPVDSGLSPAAPAKSQPASEIVRLIRIVPPEGSGPIEVKQFESVELEYELHNIATVPLENVKIGLACACQRLVAPASTLLPGESTRLRVALKAATPGITTTEVRILAGLDEHVIHTLKAELNVPIDVPQIVSGLSAVRISAIERQNMTGHLQIETFEATASAPWIKGLLSDSELSADVTLADFQEHPLPDRLFCRRIYNFDLASQPKDAGTTGGYLAVDAEPAIAGESRIHVIVETHERLMSIPSSVHFALMSAGENSAEQQVVTLIDRLGTADFCVAASDSSIMQIEPLKIGAGSANRFRLTLTDQAKRDKDSQIEFATSDGATVSVQIHFDQGGADTKDVH